MHCRPRASTCSLTEVSSRRTSKSASEPAGLSALAVSVGSVRVGSHTVGADIAVRTGSTKGTEFPGLGPVTAPARASEMNSSYVPHGALGEKLINFVLTLIPRISPQKLPSPIQIGGVAQVIIVSQLGWPGRPHVKSWSGHWRSQSRLNIACNGQKSTTGFTNCRDANRAYLKQSK